MSDLLTFEFLQMTLTLSQSKLIQCPYPVTLSKKFSSVLLRILLLTGFFGNNFKKYQMLKVYAKLLFNTDWIG